jgi:hypothetical protein
VPLKAPRAAKMWLLMWVSQVLPPASSPAPPAPVLPSAPGMPPVLTIPPCDNSTSHGLYIVERAHAAGAARYREGPHGTGRRLLSGAAAPEPCAAKRKRLRIPAASCRANRVLREGTGQERPTGPPDPRGDLHRLRAWKLLKSRSIGATRAAKAGVSEMGKMM